jgi:uncharacterized membrane protein
MEVNIMKKNKNWWIRVSYDISKKDPNFMDINPNKASLKKVVYWRVISTFISMIIAYYYISEISTSIEMTIIEAGILTTIHYVFEELWGSKMRSGK